MPRIVLTLIKSFTRDRHQGNPAAVCISRQNLTERSYQTIAWRAGCSESVFITLTGAMPELRFFSPEREMPMCGHATLAAAHFLRNRTRPACFKTKSGNVLVRYWPSGLIEMAITMEPRYYSDVLLSGRIAQLLGIDSADIVSDPVKLSVGTPKVLVKLCSEEILWKMRPDFKAIAREIPQGIYLFVEMREGLYHARQFNPATGINEDPVTGIAAAALGAHLKRNFEVQQGHLLNRKGTIFVDVSSGLTIGGYAVEYDKLTLVI